MVILCLMIGIFVLVSAFDYKRTRNFDDFVVAGRSQSRLFIVMSLMATIIGASATLGVADKAYNTGFPAFWWLFVGAIGLILQSILLSERIKAYDAYTLPDLARKTAGIEGQLLIAFIIMLSWTGIIAAQFVAFSAIISFMSGNANTTSLLIITSAAIILYTAVGGQLSIIKTDAIQFVLLAAGIIYTYYHLFSGSVPGSTVPAIGSLELINGNFGWFDVVYYLFIVGGTYFIGPDVFSRNFSARDGKTAKNAALIAGLLLVGVSFIITMIGVWGRLNIANPDGYSILIYIMSTYLPKAGAAVLAVGLMAALISSADTCLVTTAAIIENDLLQHHRVLHTRVYVILVGLIALIIAIMKKDIISLLLTTYSVFAPGIVCPLFIAIWFYKKKSLDKALWLAAIIVGGGCGMAANVIHINYLPLLGMACSLVLSIFAVYKSKPVHN